ncbi:hypothetical protein [Roseibium aestuarii]|uniref:Uncharacterized protein n=1 Tax=Roseibium aestuarii TaxID=2600299 RepID=A0ABW4JSS1_9HYPH|nr:hypothetical protein [Roseibium aestuarii]
MTTLKSLKIALIATGSLIAASSLSAQAASGPGMGASLGNCYDIWINYCNENTSGYPNKCYGESLDMCDAHYKKSSTPLPPKTMKDLKAASLRHVKPAAAKTSFAPVKPTR